MNKIRATSLIAIILTTNACTREPEPLEQPTQQERKSYIEKHYKRLPQSIIDGIPFPANNEQAKLSGFTDCEVRGDTNDKQFKCILNRKIKFEGFEFESGYIELNTYDNLIDYPISQELGFSTSDLARFQSNLTRASVAPSTEYSYRSIHVVTKNRADSACTKRNAHILKKQYAAFEKPSLEDCSSDGQFIEQLEKNGWVKICYEAANGVCAYYSKNAHFRIVNLYSSDFEVEPLSPSHYGAEYNKVVKQQELKNQSNESELDFIKSMKN